MSDDEFKRKGFESEEEVKINSVLKANSKLKFHKLFQKTYGIIYERNSDVFIDFFRDLEEYYDTGEVI